MSPFEFLRLFLYVALLFLFLYSFFKVNFSHDLESNHTSFQQPPSHWYCLVLFLCLCFIQKYFSEYEARQTQRDYLLQHPAHACEPEKASTFEAILYALLQSQERECLHYHQALKASLWPNPMKVLQELFIKDLLLNPIVELGETLGLLLHAILDTQEVLVQMAVIGVGGLVVVEVMREGLKGWLLKRQQRSLTGLDKKLV
jgi:hypothetical protein